MLLDEDGLKDWFDYQMARLQKRPAPAQVALFLEIVEEEIKRGTEVEQARRHALVEVVQ